MITGRPRVLRLMGAGLRTPTRTVPGTDLAGVVEAVGASVSIFKPGDAVFGECVRGMQWVNGGAGAERAVAPRRGALHQARECLVEQAATVPTAGFVVMNTLRGAAAVRPGQRVLINGAAGAVGAIAVQVAKARGGIVTAVDRTETLPWLRSLGADRVIDFTTSDVAQDTERFHVVFDVASTLAFRAIKRVLTPDGIYVVLGHDHYGRNGRATFGSLPQIFSLLARALVDRHLPRPDFSLVNKAAAMAELAQLLGSGALTPRVASTLPLTQAAAALDQLVAGTAVGRLVLVPP